MTHPCMQVAHYLILTHLRESTPEMPLLDAMAVGTRKRSADAAAGGEAAAADGQPASKRAQRAAGDPVRLRCRLSCVLRQPASHMSGT